MKNHFQEQYTYSPLSSDQDSIRLVEVFPGEYEDPIKIRIYHTHMRSCSQPEKRLPLHQIRVTLPDGWRVRESCTGEYLFSRGITEPWLKDHPNESIEKWKYTIGEDKSNDGLTHLRYDALSYTWGSPIKTENARVVTDADLAESFPRAYRHRHLPITSNLAVALRYLRDGGHSRTLWVDAICINQEDKAEKSIHVRMMGAIYRRAYRVVAFLGAPADSSQLAISTLRHLGSQVTFESTGMRCPSMEAVEKQWYKRGVVIGWPDATWNAILRFLERPWFSRLWIIQEVRLAGPRSIIQCGEDSISLHLLHRAIHCLRGKDWLPSLALRLRMESTTSLLLRPPVMSVAQTLKLAISRGCADPCDKVFGILYLVPEGLARRLSTIYAREPTVVYRDMFLAHLRQTRRLELFTFCYQAGRRLPCSSWVPDLSASLPVKSLCPEQFASSYSMAHFCFEAPGLLALLGVSATVIQEVLQPLELDSVNPVEHIRSWEPQDLMTGTYPTGISLLHAHARTLRMNRFKRLTALQSWLDTNANAGLWGPSTGAIPPEAATEFALAIQRCEGRAYIRTRDGYIGLAPPDTRAGDMITVFLGCSSPIVLRPEMRSGRQRFRLVGECFVLGLEAGFSLLGPLPKPWRSQRYMDKGKRPGQHLRYIDANTGAATMEDPRLGSLGSWTRLSREERESESEARTCDLFQNKDTGEVMDSDPRLLPQALLRRGVKLRFFSLI